MTTKPPPNYMLRGRITNLQGDPLEGLIVRAFDKDPKSGDDLLGQSLTDANGRYTIRYTEAQFKSGGVESGGPDVYIRVYDGEKEIGHSDFERSASYRIEINLALDYETEAHEETVRYVVQGRITQPNGNAIAGAAVRVTDKKLLTKNDLTLGEIETDESGSYAVHYHSNRDVGGDILVEVLDDSGTVVAASPPGHGSR